MKALTQKLKESEEKVGKNPENVLKVVYDPKTDPDSGMEFLTPKLKENAEKVGTNSGNVMKAVYDPKNDWDFKSMPSKNNCRIDSNCRYPLRYCNDG